MYANPMQKYTNTICNTTNISIQTSLVSVTYNKIAIDDTQQVEGLLGLQNENIQE